MKPTALQPGDSGYLVVDAYTSVAYGHVVARTNDGNDEVYVMPLYTTVRQMKSFFRAADVRLPTAKELADRIAKYNNRSESEKMEREEEEYRETSRQKGRERERRRGVMSIFRGPSNRIQS